MRRPFYLAAGVFSLLLTGCVSPPTQPSVMVLPGSGKSYERFGQDQIICQNLAQNSVNGSAQTAANNAAGTAAAGTVVGAAAGALIGAASHNAGAGAMVGAGTGLLVGSSMGNDVAGRSSESLQDTFDRIYTQCMYAKGNKIPIDDRYRQVNQFSSAVPPDYYPARPVNSAVPDDVQGPSDSGVPPDYPPE
ncbi:YMGG-like glycine zipper-containing protein [Acerihabitans sp. TG2]|uniref:glycine zipper family protein n=1 Tax=Acerihabitans sp. TG2 TaxID=3096008 RepID=UPI002B22EA4A|nr:YMGG-like glycine zipper-containing protein [Acerihabitans sp. TG2]MEA9392638.1 YMGG-like glycine zipper-containing protein [Acerihabitans sp. TG2]